jgi:hypothetical protein
LLAFSNPTTVRETGGEEREPNSIERAVVLKRENQAAGRNPNEVTDSQALARMVGRFAVLLRR